MHVSTLTRGLIKEWHTVYSVSSCHYFPLLMIRSRTRCRSEKSCRSDDRICDYWLSCRWSTNNTCVHLVIRYSFFLKNSLLLSWRRCLLVWILLSIREILILVLSRYYCRWLLSEQLPDSRTSRSLGFRFSNGRIVFAWTHRLPLRYLPPCVVLVTTSPLLLTQSKLLMLLLLYLLGRFVLIVECVVESCCAHLVALCHRHWMIILSCPSWIDYAIVSRIIDIINVNS